MRGTHNALLNHRLQTALIVRVGNTGRLHVKVQLRDKGLSEAVALLDGVHGLEDKVERCLDVLVVAAGFEILHEDACGNVQAKGHERVHLDSISNSSW